MWTLQKTEGPLSGGWQWYDAKLDPWETPPQFRYGASLAALAIGSAPADLRNAERVRALESFLQGEAESRPLHVRLAMLWASTKMPSAMTAAARQATIDELLRKQQPDGGWTLESLGPWTEHPAAPASPTAGASDSYATAFTAYVLTQAGGRSVRSKSDRAVECWPAVSMNKTYPAGSMQEKFMQDAATAYAAAVLAVR